MLMQFLLELDLAELKVLLRNRSKPHLEAVAEGLRQRLILVAAMRLD